jgi:hypothetical protein
MVRKRGYEKDFSDHIIKGRGAEDYFLWTLEWENKWCKISTEVSLYKEDMYYRTKQRCACWVRNRWSRGRDGGENLAIIWIVNKAIKQALCPLCRPTWCSSSDWVVGLEGKRWSEARLSLYTSSRSKSGGVLSFQWLSWRSRYWLWPLFCWSRCSVELMWNVRLPLMPGFPIWCLWSVEKC